MDITLELLQEFKDRMHITHSSEDDNLKRLLSFSYLYIKSKCGYIDIYELSDINQRAKELVFERSRYAYNDALEYFEDNFLSDITSLAIDNLPIEEGDTDATI